MSAADGRVQFHKNATKEPGKGLFKRFWQFVLRRVWYVHPDATMLITAPPFVIKQMLAKAARPSTQRLHLRNLFAQGRRYQLQDSREGFQLMTTNKVSWHHRRRTQSTSIVLGKLTELDDDLTHLYLKARFRVSYLLDVFLWPAFMTSIIIFMPWHPLSIITLVVLLFGLSWISHRNQAALEALEMVYFVQQALQDFVPKAPVELANENVGVIYNHRKDFREAWQRFYAEHTDDDEVSA